MNFTKILSGILYIMLITTPFVGFGICGVNWEALFYMGLGWIGLMFIISSVVETKQKNVLSYDK